VLEAADGAQASGWPAFHKSTVHTSPMLYDLDFDGVQDILLATYDGEILAFRDSVRLSALSETPLTEIVLAALTVAAGMHNGNASHGACFRVQLVQG